MENLKIREFSQAIINFVNDSPLPIEVKRLTLVEILHQIDSAANSILQREISERDSMQQEKEEQDNGTEEAVRQD